MSPSMLRVLVALWRHSEHLRVLARIVRVDRRKSWDAPLKEMWTWRNGLDRGRLSARTKLSRTSATRAAKQLEILGLVREDYRVFCLTPRGGRLGDILGELGLPKEVADG